MGHGCVGTLVFFRHDNIMGNMKLPRVVLDTNVLVAASRSRLGASFALLQAMRNRQFLVLLSVPLMLEYEAVLKRPEQLAASGRSVLMTDAFLDALCLCGEAVHLHYLWRPQLRDPADEMVLETALNGRADVQVSMNIRDFATARRFRLKVATPSAFLRQLREEQP